MKNAKVKRRGFMIAGISIFGAAVVAFSLFGNDPQGERNRASAMDELPAPYIDEGVRLLREADPTLSKEQAKGRLEKLLQNYNGPSEILSNPSPPLREAKSAFVGPMNWSYRQCVDYFGPPRTRNQHGIGFSTVKDGYVLKVRLANEHAVCASRVYYYHTDNEQAFLHALKNGEPNSPFRIEIPRDSLDRLVRLNGIAAAPQERGGMIRWQDDELTATYGVQVLIVKPRQ